MRVYISCHHPDPANAVAGHLEAAGHAIVSTWHRSTDPRPAADDAAGWRAAADRNCEEIEAADALVLVASPGHLDGTARVPGGKFVEAGYAAGLMNGRAKRCRIVTLGGVENGMLYGSDFEHAADVPALLAILSPGG